MLMFTKIWFVNKENTIHTRVIKNLLIPAFISSVSWLCHGSGGYLPACHYGGSVCIPDQPVWEFWGANWHWKMFLSECLDFLLAVSFCQCSIPIFYLSTPDAV